MKKYDCAYQDGYKHGALREKISASSPKEAYQKYIEKYGVHDTPVIVDTGLLSSVWFDDHIEKITEPEKSTKQNSTNNEIPKSVGLENLEGNTEKLLAEIIKIQERQFTELKKLNFKILMFWIFIIVIPLLAVLLFVDF